MYSLNKSLWIKVSAKCVNVLTPICRINLASLAQQLNVNSPICKGTNERKDVRIHLQALIYRDTGLSNWLENYHIISAIIQIHLLVGLKCPTTNISANVYFSQSYCAPISWRSVCLTRAFRIKPVGV